ncbi:MAG TPA: ABC transporter substrate-binding protein [Bacilli bacterium]|jgi:putative ABC transport system substrate-binding protein|nr:ABC transporter substrate-binding protein [Bacilli bacterium]HPA98759.1 ABC transporter substrate-binding protein [Bacilli bacterium]HPX83081.1 ABC transporter substrate-binding protein [Bacilli bacterium]HQO93961.1 ABC transporter substrate-binding protein [Bacilli bacterium]HQQ39212.1 ABC transporter substrate-binding protein [Bacilli bacterium]
MKLKRMLAVVLVFVFGVLLVACKKDDKTQIGILQLVAAPALDEARIGFLEVLEENGFKDGENIKVTLEIPNADQTVMMQQAKSLVRNSDLILSIATNATAAAQNALVEANKTTPLLFTAVTDPVAHGFVESMAKPGGHITGTSDMNPVAEQVGLAKELLPEATKIGFIYNSNEENSRIQVEMGVAAAEALGMTTVVKTISEVNQIDLVANNLFNEVDVVYVPTDNMLAQNMVLLTNMSLSKKKPIIAGEENQVRDGASITFGINYRELGRQTGQMAVEILKNGKLPKDIPAATSENLSLIVNKTNLEAMGITVSQALLDRADEVI